MAQRKGWRGGAGRSEGEEWVTLGCSQRGRAQQECGSSSSSCSLLRCPVTALTCCAAAAWARWWGGCAGASSGRRGGMRCSRGRGWVVAGWSVGLVATTTRAAQLPTAHCSATRPEEPQPGAKGKGHAPDLEVERAVHPILLGTKDARQVVGHGCGSGVLRPWGRQGEGRQAWSGGSGGAVAAAQLAAAGASGGPGGVGVRNSTLRRHGRFLAQAQGPRKQGATVGGQGCRSGPLARWAGAFECGGSTNNTLQQLAGRQRAGMARVTAPRAHQRAGAALRAGRSLWW